MQKHYSVNFQRGRQTDFVADQKKKKKKNKEEEKWKRIHQYNTILFPLAFYFTYGNVYVSMLFSQFIPPSPSPTVSTSVFSRQCSTF